MEATAVAAATRNFKDIDVFGAAVSATLEKWLPADIKMQTRKIVKTNDRVLTGLIISSADTDIAPTIYLDPYMDAIRNGGATYDEVIENILRLYKDNKTSSNFDTESFLDWGRAKERITFRLINWKANDKFLKDVPHIRYLDLAVIFTYLVEIDDAGQGNIVIHDCHAKNWGVDEKALYEVAMNNSPELLPMSCMPMSRMLEDLLPDDASNSAEDIPDMLVLTNRTKTYGAAVILYPGLLKSVADQFDTDFWLLPSSVHEVLLLPAEPDMDIRDDLSAMVREVNASQVPDGEILSDHAYYYSRSEDELR